MRCRCAFADPLDGSGRSSCLIFLRIPRDPFRVLEAFLFNARIGFFGATALVLLRMTVGWHILYEGIWKYQQEEFSADGYLSMASGPFADYFRNDVVEDFEGRKRLTEQWNVDKLSNYRDGFVAKMNLDDNAKAAADAHFETRKKYFQDFFKENTNATLFADYSAQWDRINKQRDALATDGGTSFDQQRLWEAQQNLRAEARPWLKWIDDQHDGFHADLRSLQPIAQQGARIQPTVKEIINDPALFVTYASIAIGVCMIAGLFTRLASLGGGIFLLMIVAAKWEWPGYYAPPAHPAQGHSLFITKEFIEMMCCFTLATLPTGRWAGFDYFLHGIFVRPFLRNKD